MMGGFCADISTIGNWGFKLVIKFVKIHVNVDLKAPRTSFFYSKQNYKEVWINV